ncbi:MAG: pyridoxal phosphate-dependent aminotransferase [Actinobacteria bacterium]|jgi:aspartate/methionine/tyrosine aminotransferase|nr:pyridoxal phosphate-dependent aminotransferase [Actinomycetota bacterium]
MRANLVSPSASHLSYAIRDIVKFGEVVRRHGVEVTWENIGDPIAKGETVAPWIRGIMHEVVELNDSWGYCPTEGFLEAREALAAHVNLRPGARVGSNDIIFFNGVADAVAKVYGFLSPHARVIGPSPAYSTHSSAESAHCALPHLTYDLDPDNGWLPDLDDLRRKIEKNPSIAGILIINPNNPTGAVYPVAVLEEIVNLAREFCLFLVADEIYIHMVFPGVETVHLSEVATDVPAIVMRGISKELPWPGSRCGWIEVLNRSADSNFSSYVDSVVAAKRLEVCSTSGPQLAVPRIFGDPRYTGHLAARAQMYADRAKEAGEALQDVPGIRVHPAQGAFYMTVLFEHGALDGENRLTISDSELREVVASQCKGAAADARFVYHLLASRGICVVPLTGFYSPHPGFRFTLLETDDAKRAWIFRTLAEALVEYLESVKG